MDSLEGRQSREFLIAWRLLQRRQGDNPLDQRAFLQKALRRFQPDQIVDQLRRLVRRADQAPEPNPSSSPKCRGDKP